MTTYGSRLSAFLKAFLRHAGANVGGETKARRRVQKGLAPVGRRGHLRNLIDLSEQYGVYDQDEEAMQHLARLRDTDRRSSERVDDPS